MNTINSLLENYVFIMAFVAWGVAQVLKTLIHFLRFKRLKLERMVGAGGMPSAHSASVCAATIAISKVEGVGSPIFALAVLVSGIVMYDAVGVRRAAGEQAKIINVIVKRDQSYTQYIPKNKGQLKEYLGHTPLEVMAGALLGILIAAIF